MMMKEIRKRTASTFSTNQASLESELRLVVSCLEQFVSSVKGGLDHADWVTKRDIIRALVKRVEVQKNKSTLSFGWIRSLLIYAPEGAVCKIVGGVVRQPWAERQNPVGVAALRQEGNVYSYESGRSAHSARSEM
jgi:hypothetical protein